MDEDISSDDDRDQTNSSMITKSEIKIGDEFLKILLDTLSSKIPNVDKDELRLHVFSESLSGDAKKWWNDEGTKLTPLEGIEQYEGPLLIENRRLYTLQNSCVDLYEHSVSLLAVNTLFAQELQMEDSIRREHYQGRCGTIGEILLE
ncbi:hypothetical protein Tco_0347795 [Tanacetum coccineum]